MDLATRISKYSAIEKYRDRPLIVYATSTRANVRAMMAADAIREFIDQVNAVPKKEKAVDILLHSNGGDALTAWKIMSVLRERFETVGVLVPYAAFSAATVFALGADEILMHPNASLGPIDPQITVRAADGQPARQFAYEDLGAFLGFLKHDVHITEQERIVPMLEKLFATVDPLVVGAARRASDLSAEVGARLLNMHVKDERKSKQIAVGLNKSFFAHGDAVSRKRARDLEMDIGKDDPKLEAMMWDAFLAIEAHMDLRTPFNPVTIFMANAAAAASVAPRAALALPVNAPPALQDQLWNAVANQALQGAQGAAPEVSYSWVSALIESPRVASQNDVDGTISAVRQPNGDMRVAVTDRRSGWHPVAIPAPGADAA